MSTGYSNKSLSEKLGLKEGMSAYFHNCPFTIKAILSYPQPKFSEVKVLGNSTNFILCFVTRAAELKQLLLSLLPHLDMAGMLWVAWPKQESKMPTDLNENIIREIVLEKGVVDVKVTAIDETWSGLKFVYRLADRKKSNNF